MSPHPAELPRPRELAGYLANLAVRLPKDVYRDLVGIASRHNEVTVHREKGVDVFQVRPSGEARGRHPWTGLRS